MRVPHALAAVAAVGALIYGLADPVNSALTAATQAKESSTLAARAAAASKVKVKIRPAPRAAGLSEAPLAPALHPAQATTGAKAKIAAHPGAAHHVAARLTPAPVQTAPHATESNLTRIRTAQNRHRAVVQRSAPPQHRSAPSPRRRIRHRTVAVPKIVPRVISAQESYGPSINQSLTVSRLNTSVGRRPTVYFVHGGSWIAGGRGEWAAEANRWASKGWTAVNISYRLNIKGPYMLRDIQTAVSGFERRPYVDPGRQIIVGSSAGAHLASLIALRSPHRFRGVIAWSPVISPEVAAAQGVHASLAGSKFRLAQAARRLWGSDWRSASPVSFVTSASPPLWAAAARGEWLRWSDQGELLCQAMGDRCTAAIVPGRAHGAKLARSHADLRNRALEWAQAQVS